MIDLVEMNIMFTLNGEMLISDSGSEMAFKDVEIGDGKIENLCQITWIKILTWMQEVVTSAWYSAFVILGAV